MTKIEWLIEQKVRVSKMPPFKVIDCETPNGFQFQVGRDAQSNARLANNADRQDYWLHAEGPGPHAVLDGAASDADVLYVAKYLWAGPLEIGTQSS